jgi:hypothetical protein
MAVRPTTGIETAFRSGGEGQHVAAAAITASSRAATSEPIRFLIHPEFTDLTVHFLSTALLLSLAAALVLAIRVGVPGAPKPSPSPAVTTAAQSERVVVMPTLGGQLEIAAVAARETLTRSDPKVLLDLIDLGTTVSEVRVDAVYRYHVEMARAWPLRIVAKTCLVQAGAVRPTLPVAFDTSTVERRTASGWARFDKAKNLGALESSLTLLLAGRAPLYRHQAQEAGRAVVAEFVLEWLVREQQWRRDPQHRVVVVFDDDPTPHIETPGGRLGLR